MANHWLGMGGPIADSTNKVSWRARLRWTRNAVYAADSFRQLRARSREL